MSSVGAFRMTRVLLDGRNRFSKVIRISQTQKRNKRRKIKVIQENFAIIREGKEALDRVNANIMKEHIAAQHASVPESAVESQVKN